MSIVAVTYPYTDDVATRDRVLPASLGNDRFVAGGGVIAETEITVWEPVIGPLFAAIASVTT